MHCCLLGNNALLLKGKQEPGRGMVYVVTVLHATSVWLEGRSRTGIRWIQIYPRPHSDAHPLLLDLAGRCCFDWGHSMQRVHPESNTAELLSGGWGWIKNLLLGAKIPNILVYLKPKFSCFQVFLLFQCVHDKISKRQMHSNLSQFLRPSYLKASRYLGVGQPCLSSWKYWWIQQSWIRPISL